MIRSSENSGAYNAPSVGVNGSENDKNGSACDRKQTACTMGNGVEDLLAEGVSFG